jgi:hypothetical protein
MKKALFRSCPELFFLLLTRCANSAGNAQSSSTGGEREMTGTIQIGRGTFTVRLFDNAAANALIQKMPMTILMSELNGNEKCYYMPDNLPTEARSVGTINAGDLMLYGSDCLVLFYKRFSTSSAIQSSAMWKILPVWRTRLASGSAWITFNVNR